MLYERQCFLNADPYRRYERRVDQANGFYQRHLTTKSGSFELNVPRSRSGLFHSQVLLRYKPRDKAVDEAIKSVFLLGVSTRQTGRALSSWIFIAADSAGGFKAGVHRWGERRCQSDLFRLAACSPSVLLGAQDAQSEQSLKPLSSIAWPKHAISTRLVIVEQALKRFRLWKAKWIKEAPEAVRCFDTDLEALLEFFDCPKQLWKKLRTTNAIERLFVEVRRRIRTMCAFTTRSSCERIFSVFDRMNTYWDACPL